MDLGDSRGIGEPRLANMDWALQRTTKITRAVAATGRDGARGGEGGLS